MTRLGVLVGMRSEARILTPLLPETSLVQVGSADLVRTEQAIEALLAGGATHLLSFGLAGALAPELRPGMVLAPREVVDAVGRLWPVDAAWRKRLDLPAEILGGRLLGSDHALATRADKAAYHRETSALAVDMESHRLAEAAGNRPFLVLRAIADPVARRLPGAALLPLKSDGTPDLMRLLAELARHPAQLPSLVRLGLDARAAHAALGRVARLVGCRLFP